MRILLLGSTGLLGSAFLEVLESQDFEVLAPSSSEVDVTNLVQFQNFVDQNHPDLILLCAAYTAVDKAETEVAQSYGLNVTSVENCIKMGRPLIHFSSDYVFGDAGENPLEEGCPRAPLNVYGHHKAKAEYCLEQSDIVWFNIRTSWLFGPGGGNFLSTIAQKSKTESHLSVVSDQIGRPTYAPDLARLVVDHFIKRPPAKGHYHLQNQGDFVSWADLAQLVVTELSRDCQIDTIQTSALNLPAERPLNSRLENTKLFVQLRDWKSAVSGYLGDIQ